jgi:hypothetical protein
MKGRCMGRIKGVKDRGREGSAKGGGGENE